MCGKIVFLAAILTYRRFWDHYSKNLPPKHREAIRGIATVTVWDGDLTKPQLGLDNDKISELKNCVNIYIHAACSISPHGYTNRQPSLELAEIALSSKRLER